MSDHGVAETIGAHLSMSGLGADIWRQLALGEIGPVEAAQHLGLKSKEWTKVGRSIAPSKCSRGWSPNRSRRDSMH